MQLRSATRDDSALILSLIRELAEFEHLLHEVAADEATLAEHLFGAQPRAEVLIAQVAGETAGFALYFHNFSTFLGKPGLYLEDLYIRPAYRGRGYGRSIMQRLARIAVERGCGRFEWWVLDWNHPAIEFYRSLGAQPMNDWTVQRVSGDALKSLADDLPSL
ncbi:MAG: GNAT family N-acetyltransferase [Rhodanobacteraceae bacterium]|nr:GNAT family N-acetyltransferase [Rhodanobacteraceae bacterium]